MHIVVTGANGLLGQTLINSLVTDGNHKVSATSSGDNRNPNTKGYTYKSVDLANAASLKDYLLNTKPDVVIHAGAMTQVDHCEQQPEVSKAINYHATCTIANACVEIGAKLVFLSTDFVFDGQAGPYTEEDAAKPLSIYAMHKWQAEQYLLQCENLQYAIARTQLVYGYVPGMQRSNLVLWVLHSLQQNKKINVVNDQFRTPTLVNDLADACLLLCNATHTGIWHISGNDMVSMYDMAIMVANTAGLDSSLINPCDSATLGQPAPRPPKTGFNITKAQKKLHFTPKKLSTGIQSVILQATK